MKPDKIPKINNFLPKKKRWLFEYLCSKPKRCKRKLSLTSLSLKLIRNLDYIVLFNGDR